MYLHEQIAIRLRKEEIKKIDSIIRKNKYKYDSRSHFIRCAIIKALREE